MMDRSTIRETLVALLEADTGNSYADLKEDDHLRDGLGLDSVDVVSLISQIERKFHIRLSHEELEKLVTVRDVLDLLGQKIDSSPSRSAAA